MDRTAKQIIYGGFYLIIVGLFATGFYFLFLKPAPTCFDNVKNQNEEDVDCGGGCAAACLPRDLRPLVVQQVWVFTPAPGVMSVLAKVQNPNPTLAAREFAYDIDLSGGGTVRKTISGSSFIHAGEVKYIAEFLEGSDIRDASRGEMRIHDVVWAKSEEVRRADLVIQDRRTTATEGSVEMSGRLVSRDTIDIPNVRILAIFQTARNLVIGVSMTEIDRVRAGEMRQFGITHPMLSSVVPERTELVVSARRP